MNRLPLETRTQILRLLVEGNSIRAIARISAVSKNTVVKLLCSIGAKCLDYQDEVLRDLPCKRLQCDEIWSFFYAKEKNVPSELRGQFGFGDLWTWTAICPDSKLVPCWRIGTRSAEDAEVFVTDLAGRLKHRVQLTIDGHKAFLTAVENAFNSEIDYAQLLKIYGPSREGGQRYSPSERLGTETFVITGKPDREHVSTSFVERADLTMRMSIRRFTRLTNAFSKKVENLAHAVSLHFMYYNFARTHQSLRITPAMAAGVTSHVWEMEEIAALEDLN